MTLNKRRINKKKFSIVLTDKQELGRRLMMENNHYTDILFDGGSRAGKSWIIIISLILLCLLFPGLRVLVARLRFNHARASIWEQSLLPILRKIGIQYKIDKSMFVIHIGKSQIWLGGLDDKERAEKVLGQGYNIIFLNEAVQISQSTRDILKTRLAEEIPNVANKDLAKVFKDFTNFMVCDCNPKQPTHYLFKEFYKNKDETRAVLKFLPKDNIEHLPKGYIENILEKLPKDKRARFLEGLWTYLPGAVYSNVFEKNVIPVEKNIYKFYDDITIGVDWGLHTSADIWGIKITPNIIQAYLIHEIIVLNGTTADLISELDRIYGLKEESHQLYCDHEPDRIMELEAAGYSAKPAYKEIGAGDSSVNECELFFDTACKYTFDSMVNLTNMENPRGEGFLYGKHVKENDHEADASRYAIHGWRMDNKMYTAEHKILKNVI